MPITINGSGTITGLSVGGLPDGIVDTDMIANNAVASGKLASGAATRWVSVAGSASGRSVEWTGLPAGIKQINASYWKASPASGSHLYIQLGYGSTTWDTTDIDSIAWWGYDDNQDWNHFTHFRLNNSHDNSARENSGVALLTHAGGNRWHMVCDQHWIDQADASQHAIGTQDLGGELTAIRFYLENDTTFDSGTFSINYLV